ncbi:sensor histidine kinase [Buchananella felis]|uniref:sensor histidine kinase n=1 Tax=Buchananella felis TaxID=3231492 RepID=UPI003528EC92
MRVLADKAAALMAGVALILLSTPGGNGPARTIWLLAAVALSGMAHSFPARAAAWAPGALLLAAVFTPSALPSLPLVGYDVARAALLPPAAVSGRVADFAQAAPWLRRAALLGPVAVLAKWFLAGMRAPGAASWPAWLAAVAAAWALAVSLAWRTAEAERAAAQAYQVRDLLHAKLLSLRQTNARLQEAQEFETRAGVLAERTRIARDMHDGVGHSLTGLLFRVKALEVIHREQPELVGQLAELGGGLDQALSAMRASVHALADDAEDLPTSLNLLASRCGIAHVSVDCGVEKGMPARVSRCFVAVTREALTNALRHGRATSAVVRVSELPGFWRLQVSNDGTLPGAGTLAALTGALGQPGRRALAASGGAAGANDVGLAAERAAAFELAELNVGMGLRSMRDRVESLGGNLRIEVGRRFSVVAMIPKEEACE